MRSHTGTPTSTGSGCSQWVENTAVADADKPSGSTAVNVTGNTTGLGGIGLMAAQSPRGSASKNKRCRSARTCTMLDRTGPVAAHGRRIGQLVAVGIGEDAVEELVDQNPPGRIVHPDKALIAGRRLCLPPAPDSPAPARAPARGRAWS